MPCEVVVETSGLYVRYSGMVTAEDIVVLIDAMHSPTANHFKHRISDCLAVEEFQLTEKHVEHVLSLDYVRSLDKPSLKRAIVVSDLVLMGSIENWINQLDKSHDCHFFPNLESAREWLSRD